MDNKNNKYKLVFATNNAHKLSELRAVVGDSLSVLSLADIDCHDDIPETGSTLEENSMIKARWVKDRYGYDCIADDTGLEVEALG
ncbi:MAG: non-canonical purine NTP pyrophosphatase, partial [Muribaculaceae bacterium]|nr:non-canonical purine NTP pyrophosphatase [Muribaculaceae bacterium]